MHVTIDSSNTSNTSNTCTCMYMYIQYNIIYKTENNYTYNIVTRLK